MKIYFAGSIRGGRQDAQIYMQIIQHLQSFGEVLTEHVGDKTLSAQGEDGPTEKFIHDRDFEWITQCDIVVAEVTTPSLGVGYEIGRAIEMGKKVLCLHRPQEGKKVSAMILGSSDVTNMQYTDLDHAKKILDEHLS